MVHASLQSIRRRISFLGTRDTCSEDCSNDCLSGAHVAHAVARNLLLWRKQNSQILSTSALGTFDIVFVEDSGARSICLFLERLPFPCVTPDTSNPRIYVASLLTAHSRFMPQLQIKDDFKDMRCDCNFWSLRLESIALPGVSVSGRCIYYDYLASRAYSCLVDCRVGSSWWLALVYLYQDSSIAFQAMDRPTAQ